MAHATPQPAASTGARLSGYCRVNELNGHSACKPGPVTTRYGDVALVNRCDCICHRKAGR